MAASLRCGAKQASCGYGVREDQASQRVGELKTRDRRHRLLAAMIRGDFEIECKDI